MSNGIKVQKRDGSVEPLNLDKIHIYKDSFIPNYDMHEKDEFN